MTTLLTALRGLRSRALLSAATLGLMVLAVAGAVLGPIFQQSAADSYTLSRLDTAPAPVTGLSWDAVAVGTRDLDQLVDDAVAAVEERLPAAYRSPDVYVVTGRLYRASDGAEMRYLTRPDVCSTLEVEGRCPEGPGEVLVHEDDMLGLAIGDTIPGARVGDLEIVGVYTTPDTTDDWLFPSLLSSRPPQQPPYQPAPYIVTEDVVAALAPKLWTVRLDSRFALPASVSESDLDELAVQARTRSTEAVPFAGGALVGTAVGNELGSLLADIRGQRDAARSALTPAVVSLVLVALAMILRLQVAAAELRGPELALASLRGVGSRRAWFLGVSEPWLLAVLSVPLGILAGYAATSALSAAWLRDGTGVALTTGSLVAAALILVAILAISAVAVGRGMGRTLGSRLTGAGRPGRSGRWELAAELAVVLLAVALPLSTIGASRDGLGAADLLLPVAAAVATGLLTTRAVTALAGWWTRRGAQRPLPLFVAARVVARRSQGTLVILPVCAAVAVAVFAVGIDSAAGAWRASVAATTSPAVHVYESPRLPDETIYLARDLDPEGRYLMAASRIAIPSVGAVVAVDSARLDAVAEWSPQWLPGDDAADAAALVAPRSPIITMRGDRIGVTTDTDSAGATVVLKLRGPAGLLTVNVGPVAAGTSTTETDTDVCAVGCTVQSIAVSGTDDEVVVAALTADGDPVEPALATGGWTPRPTDDEPTPRPADSEDDGIVVEPDEPLVAGSVARPVPVLAGLTADALLGEDGATLETSFDPLVVDVTGRSESLPLVGPPGLMLDLPTYLLQVDPPPVLVSTVLLANQDAPPAMRDQITGAGLTEVSGVDGTRRLLDDTAYAQALRLYLVVAAALLTMALGGLLVSAAVQLPSRRRDAAALRVVGVPRRSLLVASLGESLVVLGAAAVAGLAAGGAALSLLLPSLELGVIDDDLVPRVVPDKDVGRLLEVAGGVTLALVLVALLTATAVVRRARGASLRETG